jgi:4-amino-4-deoxy-L-arabinose transferase-like glycosyltransferase
MIAALIAVQIAPDPAMQPWTVLLVWLFSIALLLVGAWYLPATQQNTDQLAWTRWEYWAVVGLTVTALLLRAYRLENLPANIHGDEGAMGLVARSILQGKLTNPFATAWMSHPTLWFFLQALSLRLFGDSIGGLRMLSALIGTAAIPALYAFARPWFGRGNALLAAGLLAMFPFDIHYSRIGLNNIGDPLMGLLAFAAFFHGYRTRTFVPFVLAGVLLGLAQHLYFGSRLLPLVLLAVLAHQFFFDRRHLWAVRWHLVLLGLGFLVAFGPLLSFFTLHPDQYTARLAGYGLFQSGRFSAMQTQGVSIFQILGYQLERGFGMFTFYQDSSPFYNTGMPLLDRFSAVLMAIGLGVVIQRWRKPESILLLAWVCGAALLGGALLVDPPQTPRYITTAPALCLLIVLGLQPLKLLQRVKSIQPHVAAGLAAVAILLLGLWNLNFYFREYSPRNVYGSAQRVTEIAYYLRDQTQNRYVYFFGAPFIYLDHPTIQFIADSFQGEDILNPLLSAQAFSAEVEGGKLLFVFLPEREGELSMIQATYPEGDRQDVREKPGSETTLFTIYRPR